MHQMLCTVLLLRILFFSQKLVPYKAFCASAAEKSPNLTSQDLCNDASCGEFQFFFRIFSCNFGQKEKMKSLIDVGNFRRLGVKKNISKADLTSFITVLFLKSSLTLPQICVQISAVVLVHATSIPDRFQSSSQNRREHRRILHENELVKHEAATGEG